MISTKSCIHTPHTPTILDTNEASALIYTDGSKTSIEVHSLDLSGSSPKPAVGKHIIHTVPEEIGDVCFVQNGDKLLLVAAAGDAGLFVYNTETGKLEWMGR